MTRSAACWSELTARGRVQRARSSWYLALAGELVRTEGLPPEQAGPGTQDADLRVRAPGRTRTCNLRIRSETQTVCLVMPWTIAAGRVGSAVQPVPLRPAP
jgi:hypothetical protein